MSQYPDTPEPIDIPRISRHSDVPSDRKGQSLFLTAVVAMVLGVLIGMIGLIALREELDPPACKAAGQQCP